MSCLLSCDRSCAFGPAEMKRRQAEGWKGALRLAFGRPAVSPARPGLEESPENRLTVMRDGDDEHTRRRARPRSRWPASEGALQHEFAPGARFERQGPQTHTGQSLEGPLESGLGIRHRLERKPPDGGPPEGEDDRRRPPV